MGKAKCDIEDLSIMTGLTTRTLRSYLKKGILGGEKEKGKWYFSKEDIQDFFASDYVMQGVKIKSQAIVGDFCREERKRSPSACLVYDSPGTEEELMKLCETILEYVNGNSAENDLFSYYYDNKTKVGRFILRGSAEFAKGCLTLLCAT